MGSLVSARSVPPPRLCMFMHSNFITFMFPALGRGPQFSTPLMFVKESKIISIPAWPYNQQHRDGNWKKRGIARARFPNRFPRRKPETQPLVGWGAMEELTQHQPWAPPSGHSRGGGGIGRATLSPPCSPLWTSQLSGAKLAFSDCKKDKFRNWVSSPLAWVLFPPRSK